MSSQNEYPASLKSQSVVTKTILTGCYKHSWLADDVQVSLMTDSDSWQGPDVRGVPSSQLCNVPHYALSTRAALRAQCTVHITPLHTCGQITWVTGVGAQMQGAPDYLTQLSSGQLLSEQVSTATIRVQTSSHRMPELLELFRRWDQLFGLAVKLIFWIE